jgi:hypothetical protein
MSESAVSFAEQGVAAAIVPAGKPGSRALRKLKSISISLQARKNAAPGYALRLFLI